MNVETVSNRSRLVALLLCIFLGPFGAHRFYVGKIGTGVLMLLTIGGLGIWALIDHILIATGTLRDKEGRRVYRWMEPAPASV
jgi:TM2 domain-containing membrane protein YozV